MKWFFWNTTARYIKQFRVNFLIRGTSNTSVLFWQKNFPIAELCAVANVVDPDQDPYVFWASRIWIRHYLYGSGSQSQSFHQQGKKVRKILILLFFFFFFTFYVWRLMLMYLQKVGNKQRNLKKTYFLASCQPLTKKAGSDPIRKSVVRIRGARSASKCYWSTTLAVGVDESVAY